MKPFFSENSPFLKYPLLTPQRTRLEVDFVVQRLGLSPGAKILDVGCGYGRHTIELAHRGFASLGIDPSEAMIAVARERAKANGTATNFDVMDATQLPFDQQFDAAICLFTTLGQINRKGDNMALVNQVATALKPGGSLVVEIPNKPWLIANLKPKEKFGDGLNYTLITRTINPPTGCVTETFTLVSPEKKDIYLMQYRIFNAQELVSILAAAQFKIVDLFSDYHGSALTDSNATIIAVAQKKER